MSKKFVTAINCMDGRAQKPVIEYMQDNFGASYIDMITEPGPNKILSENNDIAILESLKNKVKISVEKHGSQLIAIAAHYDCAGNPANDNVQKQHLKNSVDTVTSWGLPVKKIIALWLDEDFKASVIS